MSRDAHGPTGFAFNRPGGPLVAVCGLAGGAGTSTLAYLLARRAAAESVAPVLLCELDGTVGLAEIAGEASARALGEVARGVPADGPPFAQPRDGLRLIAGPPGRRVPCGPDAVARVLLDARADHGLCVVDCGLLSSPDAGAALAVATHIVWTVPLADWTATRVRSWLIESDLAPATDAPELLAAAVVTPRRGGRAGRALRAAAAPRCRRIVLMPFEASVAEGRPDAWSPALELALAAVVTFFDAQPGSPGGAP